MSFWNYFQKEQLNLAEHRLFDLGGKDGISNGHKSSSSSFCTFLYRTRRGSRFERRAGLPC
jgi:hypothetical protein